MRVVVVFLAFLVACDPDNPSAEDKEWAFAYEDLPAALLSVWGSSASDIFFAGSDPGDGKGPWVLHWDGETMQRLPTGQTGNLWWVFGSNNQEPVYFGGVGGLTLRWDRTTESFTRLTGVPADVTIFGIMPMPGGHVWAVGSQRSTGKVYELDGTTFSEVTLPDPAGTNNNFNKVWGRGDDDLWVVGTGSYAFHKSASGWVSFNTMGESALFTVHGNDDLTIGVGGFVEGKVLELTADGIEDVSPLGASRQNGVWVSADGTVTTAGVFGEIWQRKGGDTWSQPAIPNNVLDFHSVFVDSIGDVWAVGGFISNEPLRSGMLLHYGSKTVPAISE